MITPSDQISPRNNGNEPSVEAANELVQKFSKETLKSLFYMFSGKPDSTIKIFPEPVLISADDIIEINRDIQEKLKHFQIDGAITTVTVSFEKNKIKEFGTWAEFETHKWTIPETTESVLIKWDFLAKLPNYILAQRHTIVLRISSPMRPIELLQYMFSKEGKDHEIEDPILAPITCRIDFINALLGEEIISIVEKWHQSRRKTPFLDSYFFKIKDHSKRILFFARNLFPITTWGVSLFYFWQYSSQFHLWVPVTMNILQVLVYWCLGTYFALNISYFFGEYFSKRINSAFKKFGIFLPFEITNGDKNRQEKFKVKNNNQTTSFWINCIVTIILNLVSAYIAVRYLSIR